MAIVDLTLDSGREIRAGSLFMEATYIGLIEGIPSRNLNDELVAGSATKARAVHGDWPVHVIEPLREPIDHWTSYYRVTESLPSYWVAASCTSGPLSKGMDGSELIVLWYQEEPFPVPAEAVLPALKAIPWEALARDFLV